MVGTFIQSYDCEGRWGVADHLSPSLRAQMRGESLEIVYARLAAILNRHRMPGTFAFVGAFLCEPHLLGWHIATLRALHAHCPGYLDSFFVDFERNDLDGWNGAGCLAKVRAGSSVHEIATHGFSHIPWDWPGFSEAMAMLELEAVRSISRAMGIDVKTVVFPRNAIAYLAQLKTHHFAGYRRSEMWRSKIARMVRELNLWEAADTDARVDIPVAIPGGQFMNVRFGVRRFIPAKITIARWRHIIDDACRHGGVAHLWCHPENFLGAPDGFNTLNEILLYVAKRRDEGRIGVVTQAEYCARLMQNSGPRT